AQSDELGHLPAFAPQRLAKTTDIFFDLVVLPLLHRALHGEKPKALCAEIEPHVASSVAFFIAACRHGGGSLSHRGSFSRHGGAPRGPVCFGPLGVRRGRGTRPRNGPRRAPKAARGGWGPPAPART